MKHAQPLSMLLMLTAAAGLAIAEPAKKETTDQDLLRGPSVKESGANSPEKDQRPEMSVDEHLEKHPMEMREVFGALRMLNSNREGNDLKLSFEQNEKIKEIMMKYREDIRSFQEEHRDQFRALRDQMNAEAKERREQRQKQAESDDADSMREGARDARPNRDEGESPAARKLREFINNSAPAKAAMKSIRNTLSEDQMNELKATVVKARVRQESRRAEGGRDEQTRPARRGMDSDNARPQRRERNQDRDSNGDSKREKPSDDD